MISQLSFFGGVSILNWWMTAESISRCPYIDASPANNKPPSAIRAGTADAVAGYDLNQAVRAAAGIVAGLLDAFFGSGC
jgi:hypothetical protein